MTVRQIDGDLDISTEAEAPAARSGPHVRHVLIYSGLLAAAVLGIALFYSMVPLLHY